MKAASISEIKKELKNRSQSELMDLCLSLGKFKTDNKAYLTYLIFESSNEVEYINTVKTEITNLFTTVNTNSYFYIKKTVRKILKSTKTYIRYSKQKKTELELLIFFCQELKSLKPSYRNNTVLTNMYNRQLELIKKAVMSLHEDLQFDYVSEIEELEY